MSNFRAIAAVTQVLKEVLKNGLSNAGLDGDVSALALDTIETGPSESNRLNLYMYMTNPNLGWRNRDLPSRNSAGQKVSNPYLALDLHYVLSAFGNDDELFPEQLLGCGMLVFHELGVLPRPLIDAELIDPPLSVAGLSGQFEQIKISPEVLSTEEVSRLWTSFGAKHRRSAYYKATVVLIESESPSLAALPVKQSLFNVQPFKQPHITKVASRASANDRIINNQKILAGYQLVINGAQLKGEVTSVLISGNVLNNFEQIKNEQLIIPIPDIKAGLHSVQVVHEMNLGDPPTPHKGIMSSAEAFVLSPRIDSVSFEGGAIQLQVTPEIKEDQKVTLFLNQIDESSISKTYSFNYKPTVDASAISIAIDGVGPGKYLVRIRVDNAESWIAPDYKSPFVDI